MPAYGHDPKKAYRLVPIARGKHLFPCRTQQLSLAAVTILGVNPWENSTVPNFDLDLRNRGSFSIFGSLVNILQSSLSNMINNNLILN